MVGRITALGQGVEGWQVGDRVMPYLMETCGACSYCRTGRESLCLTPGFISFSTSGGYAEKLACPARHLIRVPDELPDEAAAASRSPSLPRGTCSSRAATSGPVETVLINSVGSGIGSAAVQLAKLAGAYVIGNASSSDDKLARRRSSASTTGINHATQDVVAEVMELTGGRGVDLVYEHVGGELFQKASTRSRRTGVSSPAAAMPARSFPSTSSPSSGRRSRSSARSSTTADEVETVLELAARGQITPLVHATFPLDEATEAMAHDGAPRALRQDRPDAVGGAA